MAQKRPTEMVTVRLPIQLLERVDQVAERLEMSRSAVVREALQAGIEDTEDLAVWWEAQPVRDFFRVLQARPFQREEAQMMLDGVIKWAREEKCKQKGSE